MLIMMCFNQGLFAAYDVLQGFIAQKVGSVVKDSNPEVAKVVPGAVNILWKSMWKTKNSGVMLCTELEVIVLFSRI